METILFFLKQLALTFECSNIPGGAVGEDQLVLRILLSGSCEDVIKFLEEFFEKYPANQRKKILKEKTIPEIWESLKNGGATDPEIDKIIRNLPKDDTGFYDELEALFFTKNADGTVSVKQPQEAFEAFLEDLKNGDKELIDILTRSDGSGLKLWSSVKHVSDETRRNPRFFKES